MAKITFTQNCDYRHNRHKTTAYPAGWTGTVKRDIQLWAIEKGYGYEPIAELGELASSDILPNDSADILISDNSAGIE